MDKGLIWNDFVNVKRMFAVWAIWRFRSISRPHHGSIFIVICWFVINNLWGSCCRLPVLLLYYFLIRLVILICPDNLALLCRNWFIPPIPLFKWRTTASQTDYSVAQWELMYHGFVKMSSLMCLCVQLCETEASEWCHHVILHYLSHSNRLHMVKSWTVNM